MGGADNVLYYGDNLDVLRRHVKDESVDLVYLDPPFKSDANYNVLFARHGTRAASQIQAFEDTWQWDEAAARSYQEVVESGGDVAQAMKAFHTLLQPSDMLAYLAMMAPRLVELHRVLKTTGSLYLHCDTAASHYLKILLDSVFGNDRFRNEIIWKRTSAHGNPKRWGPVHDVLLFYGKSQHGIWNLITQEYDPEYVAAKYGKSDERGPFMDADLTGAGTRTGDSGKPWRGLDPTGIGRHWAVPSDVVEELGGTSDELTTQEKLDLLDENGYIYRAARTRKGGMGFPRWKRYLLTGQPIQDVITDIPPINSQAKERLGYPTQKPEALMERIIRASSNEGGIVLDPFCGCGTTVAVAHRLKRNWVGIDITHLAVGLIRRRLIDAFGDSVTKTFRVIGEPTSLPDAQQLARDDPYQFQFWILGLVGARPSIEKKGADKGIDGRIFFHDEAGAGTRTKQVVISVKAGKLLAHHVRELRGVMTREEAEFGVLLCMEEPTKEMRKEAASAEFYSSPMSPKVKHPRLQIITVEALLAGQGIDYPGRGLGVTYRRAPRAASKHRQTESLFTAEVAEAPPSYGDEPPAGRRPRRRS